MGFNTRQSFIDAASSEKIILAHVEGVERLFLWTLDSGSIYRRVTDHYVVGLAEEDVALTEVSTLGAVVAGTWFFNHITSTVYVETTGSTNPQTAEEMIVKYRFFYSNGGMTASHDLTDTGKHVHYEGRIQLNPGYKHKIGIEQGLVSLIGGGTLKLINTDGGLDEIFDSIIFDNKTVVIFSWNRDLDFSERRVLFRGLVTDKRYDTKFVSFIVKDELFAMEQEVPQTVFDDDDAVNSSVKGTFKRWLYGRVDGLKLQSIDQIGQGYDLTGTVTGTNISSTFVGVGTSFLTECSQNDKLIVGTQEFTVRSIESDTQLTVDTTPEFAISAETIQIVPEIPTVIKNRVFQVADHACAQLTKTVVNIKQFNRVELNDTDGLTAGDFIEFSTGERIEIKNLAPGSIVVLRKNLVVIPAVSSAVIRKPIQELFIESDDVNSDKFTITNLPGGTTIALDSDVEFTLARTRGLAIDLEFTNGSRKVVYTGDKDLTEVVKPRDFIRPTALTFSTFYEILSVGDGFNLSGTMSATTNSLTVTGVGTAFTSELSPGDDFELGGESFSIDTITNDTSLELDDLPEFDFTAVIARINDPKIIELRLAFGDPNHTGPVEGKLPSYVGDDTIVSGQVLGRTVDNTATGTWIQTAAQTVRDLISHAGLTEINEASFTQGSLDNRELVSIKLPLTPQGQQPKLKDVADLITKSTTSAVTLDNDLKIKFKVLNVEIPVDPVVIQDKDIVRWSIKTNNGKNIRNTVIRYRHKDVDRFTQEPGTSTKSFTSDFVRKYVGTNKTKDLDVYLYNGFSAGVMSHRVAYLNSLGRSDVELETDLRLEDVEIGDAVVVDLRRIYKRFGDSTSRKKVLTVIGKQLNGERTKLSSSDFGNVFNRSSVIAPNATADYSAATEDEKLKFGFITANNGITDDDEETDNIHLIS